MFNSASTMEKRQSVRQSAPGNSIYIYYRGKRMCHGKCKDVSSRGAFVSLSTLPIPLGAVVVLVFIINNGNIAKTIRKSAIITRITEDGIGVGFLRSRRLV